MEESQGSEVTDYFLEFGGDLVPGYMDIFKYCKYAFNHFFHFLFLCSCKENNVIPKGLRLKHQPSIASGDEIFFKQWKNTISTAESTFLNILIVEQKRLFLTMQIEFWKSLQVSMANCQQEGDFLKWWHKLFMYQDQYARKLRSKKLKKLRILTGEINISLILETCGFFNDLNYFSKSLPEEAHDIDLLLTLNDTVDEGGSNSPEDSFVKVIWSGELHLWP